MSDFEMLLAAWLAGGDVPEDFKPSSSIEFILIDILKGIPSTVDPKSRADELLNAIADKYAGYAAGLDDIIENLGLSVGPGDKVTPENIASAIQTINTLALAFLEEHGATGVDDNTLAIIGAQEALIEQGGGAGFEATIEGAPTISAIISGFTATVTEV